MKLRFLESKNPVLLGPHFLEYAGPIWSTDILESLYVIARAVDPAFNVEVIVNPKLTWFYDGRCDMETFVKDMWHYVPR